MRILISLALLCLGAAPLAAQVAVHPLTTTPAAWERIGIRVINQTDTATTAVRVEVPEALAIIAVEPMPGWSFQVGPAKDPTAQAIEWSGGTITRGQFEEFAFLGRPQANSRQIDFVLPVTITRANGSVVEWRGTPSEPYAAPRVRIVGTVGISGRGAMMMAGVAIGISLLALVIVLANSAKRRS